MPTPKAIPYILYTRLLRWESTRQVELLLAAFSFAWCTQVWLYGSVYQHVLPIVTVSGVLASACVLQVAGLLGGWINARKAALFLEAIIWTSLLVTMLSIGIVSLTYFIFAFFSAWGYLVLSRMSVLLRDGNQ